MRRVAFCLVVIGAMFAVPISASASTIHTGRIVFPEPHNPPTIGPPPPSADQRRETTHEIVVRYDARTGTVTFREEVWDPAYWGERLGETFTLGGACPKSIFALSQPFTAHVSARPDGLLGPGGVSGEATLKGYEGAVKRMGTFDGHHFQIAFTSRAFRNRNWRCVSVPSVGTSLFPPHFYLGGWSKPRHRHER